MGKPKHQPRSPSRHKGKGLLPLTRLVEDTVRDAPRPVVDFEPMNEAQRIYASMIMANTLTFGLGPAGTGKTWVAGALACRAFMNREVDKIVITRPVVEAGEELGFLPGDLNEKMEPYFRPVRDVLEAHLGKGHVEMLVKNGKIEAMPLAYMRGHTLGRSFVILDEAQNCSPSQFKLLLTRIGEDSRVVVSGDVRQRDIAGLCGLTDAVTRLGKLPGVAQYHFTREDIVRSGLVQLVVEAYENPEPTPLDTLRARAA